MHSCCLTLSFLCFVAGNKNNQNLTGKLRNKVSVFSVFTVLQCHFQKLDLLVFSAWHTVRHKPHYPRTRPHHHPPTEVRLWGKTETNGENRDTQWVRRSFGWVRQKKKHICLNECTEACPPAIRPSTRFSNHDLCGRHSEAKPPEVIASLHCHITCVFLST